MNTGFCKRNWSRCNSKWKNRTVPCKCLFFYVKEKKDLFLWVTKGKKKETPFCSLYMEISISMGQCYVPGPTNSDSRGLWRAEYEAAASGSSEPVYPLSSSSLQNDVRGDTEATARCDYCSVLILDLSACLDLALIYLELASPLFMCRFPPLLSPFLAMIDPELYLFISTDVPIGK